MEMLLDMWPLPRYDPASRRKNKGTRKGYPYQKRFLPDPGYWFPRSRAGMHLGTLLRPMPLAG